VHKRFASALFRIAISISGGQHGEEGNESEVKGSQEAGGEEDRRQEEARQEEVSGQLDARASM
jgi:hypothetical protein